jgi:hypothetical protein
VADSEHWHAPSPATDGREARQKPEYTVERRITWWQRALRWIASLIVPTYDAELEKTHAYALFVLLIPGLLLLFFNLIPFFNRGK